MSIYAVNGKEPIAAWIPSLDTAGNGTTTLTDLVGSNNGTLTNMDAATDWVSDTSNGGVRALDFSGGLNKGVIASSSAINAERGTISCWMKPTNWVTLFPSIFSMRSSVGSDIIEVYRNGTNWVFRYGDITNGSSFDGAYLDAWQHIVVAWDNAVGRYAWVNGVQKLNQAGAWEAPLSDGDFVIGAADTSPLSQGPDSLQDDIRTFDVVLDSTDIAYLYNSGNGRGIVVESAPSAIYHPFASLKHPLSI